MSRHDDDDGVCGVRTRTRQIERRGERREDDIRLNRKININSFDELITLNKLCTRKMPK